MTIWNKEAVQAAIKGWFGMWASDEERMLNALNKAAEKQKVLDLTMLLAWEDGWNAAIEEAKKIAADTYDNYDKHDKYCKGLCDASHGILRGIEELKK